MATLKAGERLQHWRKAAGISQQALADMIGIQQPNITEWEKGTRRPKPEHREALARITGGTIPVETWEPTAELQGETKAEG